jgi:AcrR family transcriptional regulator
MSIDSLEKPGEPSARSSRGRPRNPQLEARRKEQILDVAAREFARYGFANTQVQTIANHLGVGNGTVFRYFETKERLFLAAVERGLRLLTEEMDRVLDARLAPLDHLVLAIRTYLGYFHRHPEMAELFIQERAAFPHHHRPLYFAAQSDDEHTCKHTAFFRRLLDTGAVRPMPMERLFAVVGDLLYGTILTNLLSGRPADPEAQARDVTDVILNGILAAHPAARGPAGEDGEMGSQGEGEIKP